MNTRLVSVFAAFAFLFVAAYADDLDTALQKLSSGLAADIAKAGGKKVSVVDFTDLQGQENELGRFIAEHLSIGMVKSANGFSVVDRARIKKILLELKLSADGLVNPESAKKLGTASGADMIVLGTMTVFDDQVSVTAKAIAVESTDVVAADSIMIPRTKNVNTLLKAASVAAPVPAPAIADVKKPLPQPLPPPPPDPLVKEFSGLKVRLEKIQSFDGNSISVRLKVENASGSDRWVTLNHDRGTPYLYGAVVSGNGALYTSYAERTAGLTTTPEWLVKQGQVTPDKLTHLAPGQARTVTMTYGGAGFPLAREQTNPWSLQICFIVLSEARLSSATSEVVEFENLRLR